MGPVRSYRCAITSFIDKGAVMQTTRSKRLAATLLEAALLVTAAVVLVLGVVRPLLSPVALGVGKGDVFGGFPTVEAKINQSRMQVRTVPEIPPLVGEVSPGEGVDAFVPERATLIVYDPSTRQVLGLIGAEVVGGLLTCLVLLALYSLVRSLRRGDPFVPQNARRLYAIAAVVGLGGQAAGLLHEWGRASVIQTGRWAPYLEYEPAVSFVPLMAGIGIAVVAEVFRRGTQLREETQGLV